MGVMVASGSAWRRFGGRKVDPPATATLPPHAVSGLSASSWQTASSRADDADVESLLDDVLASCPDPLFIVDPVGKILRANSAANELRLAVGGASQTVDSIEPILKRVRLLTKAGPPSPFEVTAVGDLASLVAAADPVTDPVYDLRLTKRVSSAASPGFVVQLVDVTPLLSALRGRETAKRHRDEILKLLSHDLRSPHAAILATLNHAAFANVPANLRQIIERAARRSLNMVDSLVRSVRAEASEYQLEPVALVHILEEVADSAWSQANESKIKIDLDPGEADCVVMADRGMMTRAMADVLDSLMKFSVTGQPIAIRLKPTQLGDQAAVCCEYVATARHVTNGELARLFSRFSASQRADVGSLGDSDGLQFVRTVIERHGGRVTCGDPFEGRRTVTIVLPLAPGERYQNAADT